MSAAQAGGGLAIEPRVDLIEQVLGDWQARIGAAFPGYRGHVYRVYHLCLALHACTPAERERVAIAACFHDIGLWSANTLDYLPPSADEARAWLAAHGRAAEADEVVRMIVEHHRVRALDDPGDALVEAFRRADLVDFSLGLYTAGLPRADIGALRRAIPNAGFHRYLARRAGGWFLRHPLRPAPFMKW